MKSKKIRDLSPYFSGERLYGDDFEMGAVLAWYLDEKEGYAGLLNDNYSYEFHMLNKVHGYSQLPKKKKFAKAMSFGGSKGDELLPIFEKLGKIWIVEPSKKLRVGFLKNKKINYVSPNEKGHLDFEDQCFDLITCFGVLHHIPNVSFVFEELVRVLNRGGYLLLREPIVSMGDWRYPRKGLTKRERGIPESFFARLIRKNNLDIVSKRKILFPLLRRIDFGPYKGGNSKFWVYLDYLLGKVFSWNKKYHSTKFYHKIRPQSVFYVLRKN